VNKSVPVTYLQKYILPRLSPDNERCVRLGPLSTRLLGGGGEADTNKGGPRKVANVTVFFCRVFFRRLKGSK